MMKKENISRVGNNSLLQTARTKKFALLSLKSKPQPPVKNVKVPVSLRNDSGATNDKLVDDRSKVSDITGSSGEEKRMINRPAAINDTRHNDTEVESSVLGMSMNSRNSDEFSLSKLHAPITATKNDIAGSGGYTGKQNVIQSTSFWSLWPTSAGAVNTNHQDLHNHLRSKKLVKSVRPVKKDTTIMRKKTMDISKGLQFSAPAPMTLNRYRLQMGQEKTAPESKEYLEMQAKRKKLEQTQIEEKHMAEAKIFLEERLKQAFNLDKTKQEKTAPESNEYLEMKAKMKELEQTQIEAKHVADTKTTLSLVEERLKQAFNLDAMDTGLHDQFNEHFSPENKNLVGNATIKKKSMMKKILGKVRPKSSKKWKKNQEKSSAIQEAMDAVAAAVDAATKSPIGVDEGGDERISEEEARAIVSQALAVSRQKRKTDMFRPSMVNIDRRKMPTQDIIPSVDELGRPVEFPVSEVMLRLHEDSISDLGAPIRNVRKLPVVEIHMKDSKQCHGDESVSTLGTPRVFGQLNKLLTSKPHRSRQQSGLTRDFLEVNMGGSAAPPPMVTSHDARALIDELDSGTMVGGDMTVETARAENAVQFCNIATNCFHPEQKSFLMEASARNQSIESNTSSHGEESFDDSESSDQEKSSNDETWSSPTTPAFTQAIDNAIRKAEIQIAANHNREEGATLASSREAGEIMSPIASPHDSEVGTNSQTLYKSSDQQTTNFDSFMNISASKLDKKECYRLDPKKSRISGDGICINDSTPKSRGGLKKQVFGQSSEHHFSDQQFDLLSGEKSGRNRKHDLTQLVEDLRIDEHNKKNTPKRKKHVEKNLLGGFTMDQERFLLEKDDAYWDTLSTIASTANDQSSESDAYMDEFVQPGPIPGEITTSSSELKSVTAPAEAQSFNPVTGYLSRSKGNLNKMMNDVTDLIDADLLDKLPILKNKRSLDPLSLRPDKDSDMIDRNKTSSASNREMNRILSNQIRPCPKTVDSSKLEEKKGESLGIAASHITKGFRSVSWGVEEIYEDKNSHLDTSDQDTNTSEGSYSMTRKAQPYPEGMQRNQRRSLLSNDVQTGEEDLISRTLELSKGLLETIMGSQHNKKEEKQHVSSDDSRDMQYDKKARNKHPFPIECRDDFYREQKLDLSDSSENDLSPMIHSRLESLRNQRNRALSKFRRSQEIEPIKRDRERLKYDSSSHENGKPSSQEIDLSSRYSKKYQQTTMRQSYSDDSDIELKYTTSDSNASSTTPSQKARDLRMQLDQAMRASREIQISQNQLGQELNSFKNKYYYKNHMIENYATKAVHGL